MARHDRPEPTECDLGIADGRFASLAQDIPTEGVATVVDGRGLLAAPTGDVDWVVSDHTCCPGWWAGGFELPATVTDTFVRGHRVLRDGNVVGQRSATTCAGPLSGDHLVSRTARCIASRASFGRYRHCTTAISASR